MSYLWLKRGSSICGAMEAGLVLDVFFVLLLLRGSKFFFGAGVSVALQQILRGKVFVVLLIFFSAAVSDLFPVCFGVKF